MNIVKCLAVLLLTGCGAPFTASADSTAKIDAGDAGDTGISGETSVGGSNSAGAGSVTSKAGSESGGTSNGGAPVMDAGSGGTTVGGASAGTSGVMTAGTGGTVIGAGGSHAGGNSTAGAGGSTEPQKFCKAGFMGVPALNGDCTDVTVSGQSAWHEATCPEFTDKPPIYLVKEYVVDHYSNINDCTVSKQGFGKDNSANPGLTNVWCCHNVIKEQ